MALFLIELIDDGLRSEEQARRFDEVAENLNEVGGDLIEAQIAEGDKRIYLIVDASSAEVGERVVTDSGFKVEFVKEVRLVGQSVDDAKERASKSNYVVEWNLPEGLSMDRYLQRKAEKSPLYEKVPEISFERTYVCEDMTKCLCFYDSPDEETVSKARDVVEAPVDKLSAVRKIR